MYACTSGDGVDTYTRERVRTYSERVDAYESNNERVGTYVRRSGDVLVNQCGHVRVREYKIRVSEWTRMSERVGTYE